MLARLVYRWINAGKTHDGTAAREAVLIANLGHDLCGSRFTNAVHGEYRVISARRAASVILPARSCCAAVVMSGFVLSFFGSVVK